MSTTPTTPIVTTPIIQEGDLKFYYSGGYFNSNPNQSLGGEISSFAIPSGALNGLFDRVDTAEASAGDVEYRCVYLRNVHQTRKLLGVKIWIETGTLSPSTAIAISVGSSGMNGTEPMIPDEGVAPPMNFFEVPITQPDEPNIGDMYPGDQIGLWFRWIVQSGTQSVADDKAIIRIDGEREPELASSPLPPPSEPPPTGITCPTNFKWDPTQQKCVPDDTTIVCPNGYTYDNATQRCVPPSTPPPSVATFRFAVNGDFSCTSDAENTFALYKSKLTISQDDLAIVNGDFSYVDGNQDCFIDLCQTLTGIYPNRICPTIGNHDDTEDGSASDRQQIISTFPLIPTDGWYALTKRNIHFIFMDTQRSYSSGSPQHNFVVAELNKAKNDPAITWVIVSYHKPSWNSDGNHAALSDLRSLYHPLFEANGKVAMVHAGHNHIYWRSKPCKHDTSNPTVPTVHPQYTTSGSGQNYVNIDGYPIYVITGTGGRRSNHTFDSSQPSYCANRRLPPDYGTTFVTLEDGGARLHCEYILNNGTVFDTYDISKPGASTPPGGAVTCPTNYHWDESLGRCVPSPTGCPSNMVWSPTQFRCVPIAGEPPPPTSPGYPVTNAEWYYDSTLTQNTPQTINASSYDATEGIILSSNISSVTSTVITSDGYINVKAGTGGAGRIYFDYWKKARWSADDKPPKNLAMTVTFVYSNQTSINIRDGNSPTTGFSVPGKTLIFEGFGFTLFPTEIQSDVIYYSTTTGDSIRSVYPGNRTLVNGRTHKIFFTLRTDRTNNRVYLNVWMDFGDSTTTGSDNWVKVMTDRVWSSSNWNPGNAPTATDETQIETGAHAIERHHVMVRNNGVGSADLKIKDIKIGVLPYLNDTTTTPPPTTPPPTTPPPTGGGITDSNGILWMMATGQQGVVSQSRNESTDKRWSGNVTNVLGGYEITSIFKFTGAAGGGESHFALKHWGPNHSGDCGNKEGGSCCCWYDTGIRGTGEVQLQTERPHPSNHDFNLTLNATNGPLYMNNVGKGMEGNWIGLKWLVYPLVYPNGTANNGGIKLKMWVDTDPINTSTNKPNNNWRLVYDFTDTGQVLGNYSAPSEQDLENRVSDTNSVQVYAGGLHWRKLVR